MTNLMMLLVERYGGSPLSWTSGVLSVEVTRGHWKWHGSVGYLWLLSSDL